MNLRVKIDLIFVFTALVVAIFLYITFQNVNYVKESSDLVNNTNIFLYNLENLESSISQLEAASRGFIISGNDDFIKQKENARNEALERLEAITQSNPHDHHEHLEHFQKLASLIHKKIQNSEYGIRLRKEESFENAIVFVSSGEGKALMESISDIVKEIEKQEMELLSMAINENKAYAVTQNNIYKVLALFIFLVILIFHLHIRKNTFKELAYKEKQAALIKELNFRNKQLDDFVHIVSHNVRAPVNNITSLIALLNEEDNGLDFNIVLEKLNKVSSNLNETLNELIELIQINQNVNIPRQVLSFQEVCDKVIETFQGDILSKKANVICDFSECPKIKYPKSYLESIVHNLLSNALKYSAPDRHPEIKLSTHYDQGRAILSVSDNGLGMDLKKIGDKMFGLRKTFHTTVNSKGIGLFMTKAHVESLGGEISVESEVDKGTTFTVKFEKSDTDNWNEAALHNSGMQI